MTVQKFLDFDKSEGTKQQYRIALKQFFESINKNSYNYEKKDIKEIENDLMTFYNYCDEEKKYSPKTKHLKITAILQYLEFHEIQISKQTEKLIRRSIKSAKPKHIKDTPSKNTLKKILEYGNLLEKTIFIFLATTGMRKGEMLQLKIKNIHFSDKTTMINLPSEITKKNYPRITFTTKECTNLLHKWINQLPEYKENKKRYSFSKTYDKENDNRLFPISNQTLNNHWDKLLKKSNNLHVLDGRKTFTIHSLRRYFIQQSNEIIDHNYVNKFVGHITEISRAYEDMTHEKLEEKYKKLENNLTLFDSTLDKEEITEEIEILKKENEQLKNQMKEFSKFITNTANKEIDDPLRKYECKEITVQPNGKITITDYDSINEKFYIIDSRDRIEKIKEFNKENIKRLLKVAKEQNKEQTIYFR